MKRTIQICSIVIFTIIFVYVFQLLSCKDERTSYIENENISHIKRETKEMSVCLTSENMVVNGRVLSADKFTARLKSFPRTTKFNIDLLLDDNILYERIANYSSPFINNRLLIELVHVSTESNTEKIPITIGNGIWGIAQDSSIKKGKINIANEIIQIGENTTVSLIELDDYLCKLKSAYKFVVVDVRASPDTLASAFYGVLRVCDKHADGILWYIK